MGLCEIWIEVSIHITCNVNGTRSSSFVVSFSLETSLINRVNLIAFIWIPSWTNHTSRESSSVGKDYFSHNTSCTSNWREVSKFSCLNIDVMSYDSSNITSMRRGSRSLAINSLMDWLKLIRALISNIHTLNKNDN